jgi:uncharacterized protein YqjF (DUF2071 family)
MNRVFLSAEWRNLAMANFAIDPAILRPLIPAGTELDFFDGETFVSVVGFQFLNTRLFGIPIPFHRNFEEVNLRFYVRRKCAEGWRRGVVFIRELAPRRAVAFVARVFYDERYTALPMRHTIDHQNGALKVEYAWQRDGVWESLKLSATGESRLIESGSVEQFITEHYWGYTAHSRGSSEYQVDHPPWRVWPAATARLGCDVAALYGSQFVEALSAPPASAFILDGSPILVRCRSPHGAMT